MGKLACRVVISCVISNVGVVRIRKCVETLVNKL